MATSVLFIESINSMNNDVLGFSKPANNGIRIISPEKLLLSIKPPYYGDTVNIKFWKSLNIKIGGKSSFVNHLIAGYKYEYNHSKKTFTIYDSNNNLVSKKDNILSIGDMEIDFNIMKSHQLSILIDSGDNDIIFFIPTISGIYKKIGIVDFNINYINNINIGSKTNIYYNIKNICDYTMFKNIVDYSIKYYIDDDLYTVNRITYSNKFNRSMNYVYKYYNDICTTSIKMNVSTIITNVSYINSELSSSLYPIIMPIQRNGETQNNRPLYENWLIYGNYAFKNNYISYDKKDELYLDVLDISPNWA